MFKGRLGLYSHLHFLPEFGRRSEELYHVYIALLYFIYCFILHRLTSSEAGEVSFGLIEYIGRVQWSGEPDIDLISAVRLIHVAVVIPTVNQSIPCFVIDYALHHSLRIVLMHVCLLSWILPHFGRGFFYAIYGLVAAELVYHRIHFLHEIHAFSHAVVVVSVEYGVRSFIEELI